MDVLPNIVSPNKNVFSQIVIYLEMYNHEDNKEDRWKFITL